MFPPKKSGKGPNKATLPQKKMATNKKSAIKGRAPSASLANKRGKY